MSLNLRHDELDPQPFPLCFLGIGPVHSSNFDETALATGWANSTLGWVDSPAGSSPDSTGKLVFRHGTPFLPFINKMRQLPGFRVETATEGNREFLKITFPNARGNPNPYKTFYLDTNKGYALAREEWYLGTFISVRIEVTAFTEPMPGLFYPKHVELTGFLRHGDPLHGGALPDGKSIRMKNAQTRRSADISDVTVNTAENDDAFKVENIDLPDGVPIITGLDIEGEGEPVAGTADERRQQLKNMVEEVLTEEGKKKAAQQTPPGTEPKRGRAGSRGTRIRDGTRG